MSTYGWIITHDLLNDDGTGPSRVNVAGPRIISEQLWERLKNGEGREFKLYDGDGELYYRGRYLGDEEHEEQPLNDFGLPDAGCTRIEYVVEPLHAFLSSLSDPPTEEEFEQKCFQATALLHQELLAHRNQGDAEKMRKTLVELPRFGDLLNMVTAARHAMDLQLEMLMVIDLLRDLKVLENGHRASRA